MTEPTPITRPLPRFRNAGAALILQLFTLKRPRAIEPKYLNPAHAFITLRRVTRLSREEMAFRLHISAPMLDKIEAAAPGCNPQLPQIERALEMAAELYLPEMIKFLRVVHTYARQKPKRGPKTNTDRPWHHSEPERHFD